MALTQVKTSGIADDAVTLAKQAAGTDGQVITYDASGNPSAVGPGTDGQVLTSTGAGSPPAFEAIPAAGAALTGSTDNTICTVTGANAITGEATLTYNGSDTFELQPASATPAIIVGDSNRTGAGQHLAEFRGYWDGNHVARIVYATGDDTTNKDDGVITMHTTPSGGGITERLRIDSSGNVEIKTGNLYLPDGSAGTPSFTWKDEGNLDTGIFRPGANIIGFSTAGTQRVRIDNDGIKFGSDTAAANALDDYEEGTWTLTVDKLGDHTASADTMAAYTKVGNVVTVRFLYKWTSRSTTNGAYGVKLNLPFTAANIKSPGHGTVGLEGIRPSSSTRTSYHTTVDQGTSNMTFRASGDNASEVSLDGSTSTSISAGYLRGMVCYQAA